MAPHSHWHARSVTIGLFGLIGMIGMCMAPLIGRFIDKLVPWYATLLGILALTVVHVVQTAAVGLHVAVVVFIIPVAVAFLQKVAQFIVINVPNPVPSLISVDFPSPFPLFLIVIISGPYPNASISF